MDFPEKVIKMVNDGGRGRGPNFLANHGLALPVILLVAALAWSSFYTVEPTELAGLRRMGKVAVDEPIEPGPHFKIPLIDTVDRLSVSIASYSLDNLPVFTVDNQQVTLSLNVTYRIPKEAVLHLLYKVGGSGNVDIARNIKPIMADRALKVFARRNTIRISEERDQISVEIKKILIEDIRNLFGIEILDVQIANIQYTPTFVKSVEDAVAEKSKAVQKEYSIVTARYAADEKRMNADGEADAVRKKAQGDSDAEGIRAQGKANAITTEGKAQAQALELIGQTVAKYPSLVQYLQSQKWNGTVPATVMGNTAVPFVTLPAPAPAGPGATAGPGQAAGK